MCLALACLCPTWNRLEPLAPRKPENRDKPVTFFRCVVEQNGVVGATDRRCKILEASQIATAHVHFEDVVSSCKHAITDAAQVNFDALGSDVHQHNLKAASLRFEHHLQVAPAGKSGFDREAPRLF
jgi:hypothetical protein